MKIRNKKLLTKSIAMAIFMSSTLYTMPITYAAFNNNTLPEYISGTGNVGISHNNNVMNVSQTEQNAVIQWKDFSIGANATVNFSKTDGGSFNTLNYVNSGNLSQIYGTINATNGNIYIVNPAGVQIGNSAQINVGSLYVSNNLNNDKLNIFGQDNINTLKSNQPSVSGGELMSLGNINATNVTFDGNRIVLDVDRVKNGQTPLNENNITIKTTQTDLDNKNVVLGYTAYDSVNKYSGKNNSEKLANLEVVKNDTQVEQTTLTKKDGFMWVKDGEQLQAMNTNLSGNYAFRNSIDLNSTADKNVTFNSVGDSNNAFTGNLDGLGNEVYGLHIINEKTDNTGLFGVVGSTDKKVIIRNFNLISGSISGTTDNVGAVAGKATNAVIENVKNTINVTGENNVGGIIGTGSNVTLNGVVNSGAISGTANVGGLAGSLAGSTLKGESYNLGDIKGTANNIGGLVGSATHSTIGNDKTGFQMYNHLDVTGGYNVGGIVGNLEDDSTVQNVYNDGTVKATEYKEDSYKFHTNSGAVYGNEGASVTSSVDVTQNVNVANVGGIVGNSTGDTNINDNIDTTNTIKDVLNNGDISSNKQDSNDYYDAGNVGGIVGSAVNTDITNATNKENNIRGAHNVGGIAGYLEKGTVSNALNSGGDILATGARNNSGFVTESISGINTEKFNIGNMGGIVGYMYGDDSYIENSANRGTVHTLEITDDNKISQASQAANAGGIVGKIDRNETKNHENIKNNTEKAAISKSYNTGNVLGYTGVGGIAGMMYNGEIIDSYNLGQLMTTRQGSKESGAVTPLNMGGIVGDSTAGTTARIYLYNVYNKGQIGDDTYTYAGRHIGGVAGRLSGDIEKAYNNGAIYNGYSTVGGIVGWWYTGNIKNVFNTGNITVVNKNAGASSEVGGIAGATNLGENDSYNYNLCINLENAYNLGTIRSFYISSASDSKNTVGGIIGSLNAYTYDKQTSGTVNIKNVYTLGNLWAGNADTGANSTNLGNTGAIYATKAKDINVKISGANYIKPKTEFSDSKNDIFRDLSSMSDFDNQNVTAIDYDKRLEATNYKFADITWNNENDLILGSNINNINEWRSYKDKTTPILNAFMPETNGKFNDKNVVTDGIGNITNVQYGTAYDPLLTIISTTGNITMNWDELGIYGDAGLAVYGGGLTLNNFVNSDKGVGLFGGIIYSDGALNIDSYNKNKYEDIGLGSFSKVYGSSINIDAGTGTVDSYGSIISTGNTTEKNSGDITIKGGNVNTYGEIKTAVANKTTTIDGIQDTFGTKAYNDAIENVNDETAKLPDVAEGYAYTTKNEANRNGNISISATNGDVNIYYGNMENGIIDTQGDVSLSGKNIYVDSDMVIGKNLNATTVDSTGEIVVDISNIGKVSLGQYTDNLYKALVDKAGSLTDIGSIEKIIRELDTNQELKEDELNTFVTYLYEKYIDKTNNKLNSNATESAISDAIIKGRMHNFLHSFYKNAFNFKGTDNAKITVDLWNGSAFDLGKYDIGGHTLSTELSSLNITKNNTTELSGRDVTYIWVADGEQLKGVQDVVENHSDYNFALKNDINATDVADYQAIGDSSNPFTGKFDGRGNRIIGLNVDNTSSSNNHTSTDNVGVFGTIGEKGIVKNLKVYSSTFKGYDNVGAIAGTNNGTIDNVTTLGNTVEAVGSGFSNNTLDSTKYVGAAGGVVGTNNGTVNNATSRDSVIAGEDKNSSGVLTTAGGIAGINNGLVSNSQSHSAVIASGSKDNTYSLGGIVGVNTASGKGLDNVNAYGVTGSSILVDNTGGIAGLNSGTLNDAYNESIVKGSSNVGGITGTNSGNISLIVNGASVTAKGNYTGGLVGKTTGSISNGRNNGVITGVNYVGGLVGSNGNGVTLEDLTNDSSAEIIGENYVGGIAGENNGNISTTDTTDSKGTNLINRGSITGQKYVGGIAGKNNGTIKNVNNDIVLNAIGSDAMYFGGVTGINTENGTITDATNSGNINASGATFVGGITGRNDGTLSGAGNSNEGKVIGKDYVGGVAGLNTKNAKITANNNGSVGTEDNIIVIKNEGEVTAEDGGAGGIFGKNEANIQYAEFVNSGKVTGTAGTTGTLSGTGGIFGENTGIIKYSSLKNEVKGKVSGVNNVGGLIGINSGTIKGDRDENSHYYKYQIYNNGTITATGNGSNIGGLIGYNKKDATTGSLTAGYNTGNIDAGGSRNVGGIVGTNEGTVDQVFNTIMTDPDTGTNETIDGGSNVGAIIGNNTGMGKLTNAYSTNGGISNLIGLDNSISRNYKIDNEDYWKTYVKDGKAYKVLKVFLTSVSYDPSKNPDFVYNGNEQSVNISEAIANGMFTDSSGKQFDAYENTTKYDKDINLIGSNSHKDVKKTYTDWLYSGQIASSGEGETFNPNNLGYDIDLATGIKKAQIDITLNDIERIYGSLDIINNGGYGFTYNNDNLTPAMIKELKSLGFSVDSDSALVGDKTKDVGSYTWTGIVTLGSLSSNYELKNDNDGDGSITSTAISKVTPKTLTLKDLLATIVYGNQDGKGLILSSDKNTDILNGIVYGDDVSINLDDITLGYKGNSAYDTKKGNRVTADVGTYGNSLVVGNISLINNKNKNYILDTTTTGGSIKVTRATLTVGLNNVSHKYGAPNLSGYGIDKEKVKGLTNGDEILKDELVVEMTKDTALKDNNTHTNDAGENYTWTGNVSGIEGLENNYNIKVNDGQSIVDKADLTIDLNENVHHEYGKPNLEDYKITGTNGLTNGDEAFEDKLDVTMTHDDALTDNNTHTKPAGGDYTWTGSVDGIEGLEDNYNITINPGKSTVDKGHLTITVDDSNTTVGDNPSYGGTIEGWTNGDNPDDFDISFDVDDDTVLDQPGKHDGVIGVIIGDKFYPSGTEDDVFNNYDVTINAGDLTVLKPFDINDNKNWSHLYKDAPWDRNRDFKERKAEFNFVDGAIPLDEAVEEV